MNEDNSSKHKSIADRVTIVVALASAFSSAALACLNMVFYFSDRDERIRHGNFEAQATIAKSYFDSFSHLPKGEFCSHQEDALLFGRASLRLANLDEGVVATGLSSRGSQKSRDAVHNGVEAMAILIYNDLLTRSRAQCDDKAIIIPNAAPGKVVNATQSAGAIGSSYSIRSSVPSDLSAAVPTVWIHYASGGDDLPRAKKIQQVLIAGGLKAPAIQPVAAVPSRDQVRIYRRADAGKAGEIVKAAGLTQARIVNLETAYGNLPGNVFEIWLAPTTPAKPGGQLDFSKPENSGLLPLL